MRLLVAARCIRGGSRCALGAARGLVLGLCAGRLFREHPQGRIENLAGGDLSDSVSKPDRILDLRVREPGLSRLGNMVLDAGHAVATHRSTKCDEFAFAGD